jgi:hypothetical protein
MANYVEARFVKGVLKDKKKGKTKNPTAPILSLPKIQRSLKNTPSERVHQQRLGTMPISYGLTLLFNGRDHLFRAWTFRPVNQKLKMTGFMNRSIIEEARRVCFLHTFQLR